MSYDSANDAKADFSYVYTRPTPHDYIAMMAKHGYEIGEQARPYCVAVVELMRDQNSDAWPVQMLDVGCSYGMGSAFVKYGCSFDEMVAFFAFRAPKEYTTACQTTRMWLNVAPPRCDVRCLGLDCSEPAIRFAVDAGLLDGGIARDFERDDVRPSEDDIAWFRSCNLLISTGAIGYVTDRTLDIVLQHLGKDNPSDFGPFAVVTILRVFDASPIQAIFQRYGFKFGKVPGVRLPQRKFIDDKERQEILGLLHNRGLDTSKSEEGGKLYADLYVAAPPKQYSDLLDCVIEKRRECDGKAQTLPYIRR